MLLAAVVLHLCQNPSGPSLRVVEGPHGEAVEGAQVRWIPFGTHRLDVYGPDPVPYSILVRDELFAGEAFATTHADGSARLAQASVPGVVCVSKDGRRGCARWTPNDREELRVQLLRDWPLDVEVVDPTGADLD